MRIKVIIPFAVDQVGVAKRSAQIPRSIIDEGVEVHYVPVFNSPKTIDSFYDALQVEMFIVEEGLRSEEQGYDAVWIDTVSDSGMTPLRSRLNIPVIGPGLAAYHVASLLAKKFSIVVMWKRWANNCKESLNRYQLWDQVASIRALDFEPNVRDLITKPEVIFPALEEASRKAIEEDGAGAIVLGSTTMHSACDYLQEKLPVPVINPGPASIYVAKMLVDMKLSQSKVDYLPSPEPNDDLFPKRPV